MDNGLAEPMDSLHVIVSANAEEALELEVTRLRLKDRATARALEMCFRSLKPFAEARAIFLQYFPEAI